MWSIPPFADNISSNAFSLQKGNILYKSALSGFSFLAGLACYALGDVFAIISLPFIGLSLWYVSKVWVSVSALYTLSKKKRNAAAGSEEAVPLAADSEQEVSSEAADPRVQHDEEQAIPTPESRQ